VQRHLVMLVPHCSAAPRALHSFPTRRSSDLHPAPATYLRSKMSTEMNSVAGKARNVGVNTWLIVLGLAVLVFGLNTGYATWKAADRKSTRLNSSHVKISYAVFCLKKKIKANG